MFWMPRIVYTLLPYGYMLGGLWVMMRLETGFATFSGLLLIGTGIGVWFMRRSNHERRSLAAARTRTY